MATKKSAASTAGKKAASKKGAAKKSTTPPAKRWSGKVETDTTHPDQGLFLKSAPVIAKALASAKVSPKGPASGMRMLTFYINRAGHNLSTERVATLEHAKELLSGMLAKQSGTGPAKKVAAKKIATKKIAAKKTAAKTKKTTPKKSGAEKA